MSDNDIDRPQPVEIYTLLGNQRRLLVIRFLALFEAGVSIEVRQVARIIRSIEGGTSPRLVSTEDYESVYNGLIQTHLPKLAAEGLIKYDERCKEVTVTRRVKHYASVDSLVQFVYSFGSSH